MSKSKDILSLLEAKFEGGITTYSFRKDGYLEVTVRIGDKDYKYEIPNKGGSLSKAHGVNPDAGTLSPKNLGKFVADIKDSEVKDD